MSRRSDAAAYRIDPPPRVDETTTAANSYGGTMSSLFTTDVSDDGRANPTRGSVARSSRFGLMFLLLTSCAHYEGKALDREIGTAGFVRQRNLDKLNIVIKDLSSPRDSVKYFDRELIAYGYVPVLVAVRLNGNADVTFDMSRQDLRLVL